MGLLLKICCIICSLSILILFLVHLNVLKNFNTVSPQNQILQSSYNLDSNNNQKQDDPIEITPSKIDFGKIKEGNIVRKTVTISNVGTVDIEILDISSGCGCSKVNFDKVVINPNKKYEFSIVVDTHNRSDLLINSYVVSYRSKDDNIVRNITFSSVVSVLAEGKIIPNPSFLTFKNLTPGNTIEKSIDLTESSGDISVFPHIEPIQSPDWLHVELLNEGGIPNSKKLILKGTVPNVSGDFRDSIKIFTDNQRYSLLEIPLSFSVNGYFSLKPEYICEIIKEREFAKEVTLDITFNKVGKLLDNGIAIEYLESIKYHTNSSKINDNKYNIVLTFTGHAEDFEKKVVKGTICITSEIEGEKHLGKIPIIFIFSK
jgi:hypothetical protein